MKFDTFERLLSRAVDATHGERVRVEPRSGDGMMASSADPSRIAFNVVAALDFDPVVATPKRHEVPSVTMAGSVIHVSFSTEALPFMPRKGDHIVALERGGRTFAVSIVEPDEFGRVLCRCTPAKENTP